MQRLLVSSFPTTRPVSLVLACAAFVTIALATSCSNNTVYNEFQIALTSDPLADGQRVARLSFEFRKDEGGKIEPLSTEPSEQSVELTLPGVDISQSVYVVAIVPGATVKGAVIMVVRGYAQGADRPGATWVGSVDVSSTGQTAVHLVAIGDGCDEDGDGVKNCSKAGCCAPQEALLSDCDDTPGAGASSSPLGAVPACVPCGQETDYDCDGQAEVCTDSDGDGVADCDEVSCGSEGDKTIYPGADEICDGKDNDCDSQTDETSPDLDGDGTKDCVDDDRDGDGDKNDTDCAPDVAAINHAAAELCDTKDNDCDSETDEGLANCGQWDGDWDGDGRLASDDQDCNEYDARVFKGSTYAGCCDPALSGTLTPTALLARCDFDCDGNATLCPAGDTDFDGFKDSSSKDCPPYDAEKGPFVYKGAPEKCDDGVDQDCTLGDVSCCKSGVTPTEGLVDADGDCYPAGADCDDNNAAVHPAAPETCNGVDDDCNGFVDDGNPGGGEACVHPTKSKGQCLLDENKGLTVCSHGLTSATAPALAKQQGAGKDVAVICVGYFEPEAVELKCDGLDEDCDGSTDEDFDWIEKHPGAGGAPITLGKGDTCGTGECAGGTVICDPSDATKLICTGLDNVSPEADGGGATLSYCDNKDNDCDGVTDDHTLPLAQTTCKQVGVCLAGAAQVITHCVAGQWQCDYSALTAYDGVAETRCDALDGDCDGQTDEDLAWNTIPYGQACDGTGECGTGVVQCSKTAGKLVATCSTNPDGNAPDLNTEICDGQDNDCDGVVDDGLTWTQDDGTAVALGEPCNGVGQCGTGVVQCSKSAPITTCSTNTDGNTPQVKLEICDSIDNDCDGKTDNGLTYNGIALGQACVGIGTCGAGVVQCALGETVTTCSSNPNGTLHKDVPESCDGKDNDCDGEIDELLTYADPTGPARLLGEPCEGIGECGSGTVVCSALNATATCSTNADGSAPQNSVESCDAKDNDCDGDTDDGIAWTNPVTGTSVALGKPCQGIGKCGNGPAGEVVCSLGKPGQATCSTNPDGTEPRNDQDEKCNLIDDDCNQLVDDVKGTSAPDVPCKLVGVCTKANVVATCNASGAWQCSYAGVVGYEATEATCDGQDNDCDGLTDESLTAPDNCNTKGVCVGLLPSCDGPNGWVCHPETRSTYAAIEENGSLCDSLDNDCDGQTDEKYLSLGTSCTRGSDTLCQLTGTFICDEKTKNSVVCSVTGKPSGSACNDSVVCTKNDACTGGDSSVCVGSAYTCVADNLACTDDVCVGDGTCTYPLKAGFCLVGGVCYSTGQKNPQSDCQLCDPTKATAGWTNIALNTACNDGNGCTITDKCNATGTCVGTGKDCSDGLDCTVDACAADVCNNTALKPDTCKIGGTCYAKGQVNVANPCQACDPTIATSAWSNRTDGTACDDGLKCKMNDQCTAGVCAGTTRVCDDSEPCTTDTCKESNPSVDGCGYAANTLACASDGLSCTVDVCATGTCTHPLAAGNCKISGVCYAANAQNPANPCQKCDTVKNTASWSSGSSGVACEDGNPCTTADKCNGSGSCISGSATDCADTNPCTLDFCIAGTGCQNIPNSGASCPDDGLSCTSDLCNGSTCQHTTITAGACLIAGVCFLNDNADPTNSCKSCQPLVSQTAFSVKSNGASCNADTNGCTQNDSCQSGTCTAGAAADCTALGDECNTGVCASTSATTYNCGKSPKAGGTPCASDGKTCTVDQCLLGVCDHAALIVSTCYIGGTCIAENAADPTNECKACLSATSKSTYSSRTNGSACVGDGLTCTASTCQSGLCQDASPSTSCVISGVCYPNGGANPSNPCLVCNSSLSKNTWSNASLGTACTSDSLTCTDDKCDAAGSCQHTVQATACLISGVCYASNDRNSVNNCQACVPATSKTTWSNLAATTACTDDGLACTVDACDASAVCQHTVASTKCLVGGACYDSGAQNPTNECLICSPNNTNTAFWPKALGVACADDGNQCTIDQCNTGTCEHPAKVGGTLCDDGNACTSGDRCTGTTCGGDTYSCESCQTCDGSGACALLANKCFIASACYDANAVQPGSTCLSCQPGTSTSAWQPRTAGNTCYDFPVGYNLASGTRVGVCNAGTCDNAGVCTGQVGPGTETTGAVCCDTFDNDCDGTADAADTGCATPGCP